jgi:hypothetical protein
VGATLTWFVFSPWAIPAGACASMIVLFLWFWRGNEPQSVVEAGKAHPHPSEFSGAQPSEV